MTADSKEAPAVASEVIDLSFIEVADVEEIVTKFSIVHGIEQGDDALATHKKLARKATSLRLSNNQIVTVTDLAKVLSAFVEVDKLRWVDLSFNRLTGIKASFTDFKSISVLYLHANKISKFGEIKPLGELAKLRSLTLHGNPIEDKKHYRVYVIYTISSINQLDFSPITRQDRENAQTWSTVFRKKLSGETREDEF